MEYPASVVLDFIANYFWPYTRIAAMLMVMTVTGARFVPARVRLYLGLALTFAVMPAIPAVPSDIALLSLQGFMITFEQIVIGVAMGMVTQFLVQIFVMLGQILGMQSSLGFASMVDPANGQNTPLLGQLFMLLATLFFLVSDGHLKMIQLVVFSFKSLPIGSGSLTTVDFRELALWLGIMFKASLAVSLSGPCSSPSSRSVFRLRSWWGYCSVGTSSTVCTPITIFIGKRRKSKFAVSFA